MTCSLCTASLALLHFTTKVHAHSTFPRQLRSFPFTSMRLHPSHFLVSPLPHALSSSALSDAGIMSGSSSELSTPSSIGHPEALIDQIQQQIHASGYDNTVQQVFCNTVNATIAISKILYPCSNILREDDRREVERIAKTLSKDVDTIGRHIDHSIAEVDRAYDTLQSWCTATSREPGTSWDRLSR